MRPGLLRTAFAYGKLALRSRVCADPQAPPYFLLSASESKTQKPCRHDKRYGFCAFIGMKITVRSVIQYDGRYHSAFRLHIYRDG